MEFLKGEPFGHFLDSPYFMRYLQWKGLERLVLLPLVLHSG